MPRWVFVVAPIVVCVGCFGGTIGGGNASGGSSGAGGSGAGGSGGSGGSGGFGGSAGSSGSGGAVDAGTMSDASGGSGGSGGGGGGSLAADLLSRMRTCNQISSGLFPTDSGAQATVPVCGLMGALYWQADMDIDCDGQVTTQCNQNTDPAFQPRTSAQTSTGEWLDAATLPYFVIPLPSNSFDYSAHDIDLGAVAAIIYNDRVEFAVFGDQGPDNIIGEASYATAQSLGIDPNPATGGTDRGVTYLVFTGSSVMPIESHDQAVQLGVMRAMQFLSDNPPQP